MEASLPWLVPTSPPAASAIDGLARLAFVHALNPTLAPAQLSSPAVLEMTIRQSARVVVTPVAVPAVSLVLSIVDCCWWIGAARFTPRHAVMTANVWLPASATSRLIPAEYGAHQSEWRVRSIAQSVADATEPIKVHATVSVMLSLAVSSP